MIPDKLAIPTMTFDRIKHDDFCPCKRFYTQEEFCTCGAVELYQGFKKDMERFKKTLKEIMRRP